MSDSTAFLDAEEIARYGRHLVLPEVGPEGQERLKSSSVALVGTGGLGSPAALYLAAAGIGRIGLIEFDRVETSNLQRQVLYGTEDVGRPKAEAAAERLASANPHVAIEIHDTRLGAGNAMELLSGYDAVLDGTDNFPTRYLVNDACVLLDKPNVHGSIFRFQGQASIFHAGDGPCYRCLFPEPPHPGSTPDCAEAGVLGVLPGIIGSIQAVEAIKLFLGRGDPLIGRLLLFDALEMRFREVRLARDPGCPACGDSPTIHELKEMADTCGPAVPAISPLELSHRMEGPDDLVVLDVRSPAECKIGFIGGAVRLAPEELESWMVSRDRGQEIVVYCHVGILSSLVARRLLREGFSRVFNLTGGIDAWSTEIDPKVPRY